MRKDLSHSNVVATARRLYAAGPFVARTMQQLRPYLCPFEMLLEWISPGARLLDVGCGSGLFLGLVAELVGLDQGIGFDTAGKPIELALQMRGRLADETQDRLSFQRLDAGQWPSGRFDFVSLIDVLHHVPLDAQRNLLLQAVDKLAPGGMLIYKDISPLPHWRAIANRMHDLVIARQLVHLRSLSTATTWLGDAGMSMIHSAQVNRLWYCHDIGIFQRAPARVLRGPHFETPNAVGQRKARNG